MRGYSCDRCGKWYPRFPQRNLSFEVVKPTPELQVTNRKFSIFVEIQKHEHERYDIPDLCNNCVKEIVKEEMGE